MLSGPVLIIAHRGASGTYPENTLLSFEQAIKDGADVIELDVHICKTGEVVVIHDNSVDRTTDGKGLITDLTLSEIKKLNAGNNETIPTLKEVLETINKQIRVNIELKGENVASSVIEIINYFIEHKNWSYDDFIVSSFDHEQLKEVHKKCSNIPIGYLTSVKPKDLSFFDPPIEASFLIINFKKVDKELVDIIHKLGKQIWVYTVNSKNEIKKMIALGVDGIATDYPKRLKTEL